MRTIVLYINKLFFSFIPETRCFGLKRFLLRCAGAKIGKNVRVCSSAMIIGSGYLQVGDNTWIGPKCILSVTSKIIIGSNVDIAPNVFIGNGTHQITPESDRIADIELSKDVVIGNGCWLCVNSTILPGVQIGNNCVVAAGSVVTKSFNDRTLIAGVPAIFKKVL